MFTDSFIKKEYVFEDFTLPYRLRLPDSYCENTDKEFPLMLFLHGAGERGDENEAQLRIGIGTALEDTDSPLYNTFIIAPQCPLEKQWVDTPWYEGAYSTDSVSETLYLRAAHSLVREFIDKYPINTKKVFVAGISMGGYGSWDSLARHSDIYAGGFICCGSGDPSKADIYKDMTIFTYHGSVDSCVPTEGTRVTVDAIKKAGGQNITYREFPGVDHASWDEAYAHHEDMKALFLSEKNNG